MVASAFGVLSRERPHASRGDRCRDPADGNADQSFRVLHEQDRSPSAFWFGAHLLARRGALLGRIVGTPAAPCGAQSCAEARSTEMARCDVGDGARGKRGADALAGSLGRYQTVGAAACRALGRYTSGGLVAARRPDADAA